jgi:hypothetical protein
VPNAILQRFANIRRDEAGPTLVAGLFFFCVLTALMVVRPAREALGMQRGIEAIRWLFVGTVVVTLLVNPLFGLLVSRFRRLVFINATYLFFAPGLSQAATTCADVESAKSMLKKQTAATYHTQAPRSLAGAGPRTCRPRAARTCRPRVARMSRPRGLRSSRRRQRS